MALTSSKQMLSEYQRVQSSGCYSVFSPSPSVSLLKGSRCCGWLGISEATGLLWVNYKSPVSLNFPFPSASLGAHSCYNNAKSARCDRNRPACMVSCVYFQNSSPRKNVIIIFLVFDVAAEKGWILGTMALQGNLLCSTSSNRLENGSF